MWFFKGTTLNALLEDYNDLSELEVYMTSEQNVPDQPEQPMLTEAAASDVSGRSSAGSAEACVSSSATPEQKRFLRKRQPSNEDPDSVELFSENFCSTVDAGNYVGGDEMDDSAANVVKVF